MADLSNMSPAAMAAWEELLKSTNYGLGGRINSAYRDPAHNAKVGGAKKSQHMHGNAFDVNVSDLSREERLGLITKARGAGFRGIGVYNNALHFDVGPSRSWGADYTRNSLPDWASGAVGSPVGASVEASTGPAPHQHDHAPQQPPTPPQQQPNQPPPLISNALNVRDFLAPTQAPQYLRFT